MGGVGLLCCDRGGLSCERFTHYVGAISAYSLSATWLVGFYVRYMIWRSVCG